MLQVTMFHYKKGTNHGRRFGVFIFDYVRSITSQIHPEILNKADYVITLCGDANDKCPTTPPHVKRLHWGFEDPARATGTEEEIQAKFSEVRDAIRDKVEAFYKEIF